MNCAASGIVDAAAGDVVDTVVANNLLDDVVANIVMI